MYQNNSLVNIEGASFIFMTNFSGDPARSGKYPSTTRQANLTIPDVNLARNLIDEGFKVKLTKPREGEEEGFVPTYFIPIKVNYQVKYPPKIYLVAGDAEPRLLNEDTIDVLDKIRVKNVDVTLNKRFTDMGNTLYVRTMYVKQDIDDDPWAGKYFSRTHDEY